MVSKFWGQKFWCGPLWLAGVGTSRVSKAMIEITMQYELTDGKAQSNLLVRYL